jgi:arylsulfatase A-like enzyme
MVQHNDQVDAASCVFANVDPGWWEALSSARIRPTTTPALAKFLIDLGYTTGEFGKNHWVITRDHFRPRTASRNTGATSITSTPCKA